MDIFSSSIKFIKLFIIVFLSSLSVTAQNRINIEGVVYDEYDYPIPYASIGIVKKNIGTSSTEEGTFKFFVSNNELSDVIEISSIGYEPFEITVQNFIDLRDKTFILKEKITALNEVSIESPKNIVKKAFKKLKNNTISDKHKLGVLYRRWSVEDKICRYFIEQYIDVLDRGPSSYIQAFDVQHSRTSSDYRFIKNEQDRHALQFMELNNPLRNGPSVSSYSWKKIEDTFYEDEDVLVLEGTQKNGNSIKLYIGFETSKIYKVEKNIISMNVGKRLNALYLYKNNNKGKLYLSYHKRQWEGAVKTPDHVKRTMLQAGKKERKYIPISYRHEVFVLDLNDEKSKMKFNNESLQQDMTLYKIPYDENFWNSVSLPPETKFYLKNIKELEGLYGVPIQTQFLYSNKK